MAFVTQPPQQPGQSSYQGLGTYSGGPPKKRRTGRTVAIAVIIVLVLGGGGAATYFLTKSDDTPTSKASSEQSSDRAQKDTGSNDDSPDPSEGASSDRDPVDDANNTPEDVRDDYMTAYENKDFVDVVKSSCAAYRSKFGTDTSDLESDLEDYDITAIPDGDVEVDAENPASATAKIDLELVGTDETYTPKILITIVEENGEWRFCGEAKA
jgi:hypothetical protein